MRLPSTWAGARFYFEKSRDRQVWDFALGSVASAAKVNGGVIEDIRVVVNGMAPTPVRLTAVEDAVRGQQVTDQTAEQAGQIAIRGVKTAGPQWLQGLAAQEPGRPIDSREPGRGVVRPSLQHNRRSPAPARWRGFRSYWPYNRASIQTAGG